MNVLPRSTLRFSSVCKDTGRPSAAPALRFLMENMSFVVGREKLLESGFMPMYR